MIGREKGKVPYVDPDELEIPCWLYIYDEYSDTDEGYYCDICGAWLTYYQYSTGWCEC